MKLCECGCGAPVPLSKRTDKGKGIIKGQPLRFVKGHSSRKPVKYEVDPYTGCWNWLLSTNVQGYGHLAIKVGDEWVTVQAHRFYFEQKYGPIPDGLEPDHTCRNTRCVNPEHLELVTHAENIRRSRNAKLTHEQVGEIRKLLAEKRTQKEIAEMFGVSMWAINEINCGHSWGGVA